MTIRHGSRTRTRPGRRQKHSVKRDHFAFHIMLPRSRLSRGYKGSRSRVLIDFVVSAIGLPSFEVVSTVRRPDFSHGIADYDVDIRPSTNRPVLFVLSFLVLSKKEGDHRVAAVLCEDAETRSTISLPRSSF